jgi:hypothetical protein
LPRPAAPAWPVAQPVRQRLPATRARHPRELPVSLLFPRPPGFPREWRPFPAVKAFLRLTAAAAQGVENYLFRVFSLSTAWRRLSAIECGYPPHHSQAIHRSRVVYRPRGRALVRWMTGARPPEGPPARGCRGGPRNAVGHPGANFLPQLLHERILLEYSLGYERSADTARAPRTGPESRL